MIVQPTQPPPLPPGSEQVFEVVLDGFLAIGPDWIVIYANAPSRGWRDARERKSSAGIVGSFFQTPLGPSTFRLDVFAVKDSVDEERALGHFGRGNEVEFRLGLALGV